MSAIDHHFLREDRAQRWRRTAVHLREHPADLEIALENIDRWLAWGHTHPAPILEWRRRIHAAQASTAAFQSLMDFLATDNHDSETLKSCSPFVGLPVDPCEEGAAAP